jgi:hypothetical protein
MTKRILSILLVVALIGGAGFGSPTKTRAGTVTSATASPNTVAATSVTVTLNFTTTYSATSYVVTIPSGFIVPSTISVNPSLITINGTAAQTVGYTHPNRSV